MGASSAKDNSGKIVDELIEVWKAHEISYEEFTWEAGTQRGPWK